MDVVLVHDNIIMLLSGYTLRITNISLFLFLILTLLSHASPSELTVGFLVMRLDSHL